MIRFLFLISLFVLPNAVLAQTREPTRILTEAQYQCLLQHKNNLRATGGKRTWFDLSKCPRRPVALRGAYPLTPDERYIQLSQNDIACLGNAKSKRPAAVRMKGNRVALYLNPCGA